MRADLVVPERSVVEPAATLASRFVVRAGCGFPEIFMDRPSMLAGRFGELIETIGRRG